jgi:hypothetical protein
VPNIKNRVPFKTICLVCAQYKKNGAIHKDLIADIEWSPYKCRCDIFVVWAPFKGLFLTYLICGRHRTEKEQNSLFPWERHGTAHHPPTATDYPRPQSIRKDYTTCSRGRSGCWYGARMDGSKSNVVNLILRLFLYHILHTMSL